MKKYFLFACVAAALVSCSSDEFLGNEQGLTQNETGAIVFQSTNMKATRADHTGADAAALLGSNFVVEGVKGDGSNYTEVFDHYNVNFVEGTAGSTTSNTANWEYVNQDQNIKGTSAKLSAATGQSIKYWDYSASQYDFVGVSLGKGDGATPTYAKLSEIDYSKLGSNNATYTLTGTTQELAAAYIADLVTAYKADMTPTQPKFNEQVNFKFRTLGSKVRFGFYETVPGYSVSNVKFYNAAGSEVADAKATVYASTAVYPSAGAKGEMSVSFPTVGSSNVDETDYNKAHVSYNIGTGTLIKDVTIGALNYLAAADNAEDASAKYLGRTSATATYAKPASLATAPTAEGANDGYYEVVLPYEAGAALNLKVDYTLTSIDGSSEVINVKGATAVVPQVYTRWMPNYAYTYLFKISQNTNGYTGTTTDPVGLYPITFDAVVMNDIVDGIQETITTVAKPSITTYSKGKQPTATAEYETGKTIYVMVDNGEALTVGTNAKLYTVALGSGAAQTINEESVKNALENGKKYTYTVVTTGATLAAGTTYYKADHVTVKDGDDTTVAGENEYYTRAEDASGTEWVVKDAKGAEMVVTASTLLQDADKIEATDALDGNEVAIAGAKFKPTAAGTYVFQYVTAGTPAVLYANATEYNTAMSTSLDDAAFAALTDEQKTKTPAVPAVNQVKIIIVH